MSQHLPTLLGELSELLRLHERMLDSARERQRAMRGRQVEALERLMTAELKLAQSIQDLERRRQLTMLRIGAELGRQPRQMAGVTVEQLAGWLPSASGSALLEVRHRLQVVVVEIRRLNEAMTQLAQRCLPWFDEALGVLLGGGGGQPCYTQRGRSNLPSNGVMGVVDIQV